MSFTVKFGQRDPLLFCEQHWGRVAWHRQAWAQVWVAGAIQDDRRLVAALGLVGGTKPSQRQIEKALAEQPACCRLGVRAEHLWRP